MSDLIGKKDYKSRLQGLCVVEISGESCANCLTLMPLLETLCSSRNDVKLVHVEADYSTVELMEEWGVEKVPTILLTDDGEIFARCSGYQPEEILEIWLDAKIEERKSAKK
jgi:thioredoxin-like negative regulator of GroEL